MEALEAIFRNLYTGFLLRDFAGKIVPGVLLLFSICSVFLDPKKLVAAVRRGPPISAVVFLCGLCWTLTLGTQSVADSLGAWEYFAGGKGTPSKLGFWKTITTTGDETGFDADTIAITKFQETATDDEKQQYERFVVIKEACGNLYISILLSIPAWAYLGLRELRVRRSLTNWRSYVPSKKLIVGFAYLALTVLGLRHMHLQHAHRQTAFAANVTKEHAEHKTDAAARPPTVRLEIQAK